MFIFNHDIILWGIDSVPEGIFLFFMTVLGCMSFASLTQGWFIAKTPCRTPCSSRAPRSSCSTRPC